MVSHPSNITIHLAANMDLIAARYADPAALWSQLLPPTRSPVRNKLRVTPDCALLVDPSTSPLKNCVVAIGAIESTYYCQTIPGISDFLDPELAPLLVFLQYLTQLEVETVYH